MGRAITGLVLSALCFTSLYASPKVREVGSPARLLAGGAGENDTANVNVTTADPSTSSKPYDNSITIFICGSVLFVAALGLLTAGIIFAVSRGRSHADDGKLSGPRASSGSTTTFSPRKQILDQLDVIKSRMDVPCEETDTDGELGGLGEREEEQGTATSLIQRVLQMTYDGV